MLHVAWESLKENSNNGYVLRGARSRPRPHSNEYIAVVCAKPTTFLLLHSMHAVSSMGIPLTTRALRILIC